MTRRSGFRRLALFGLALAVGSTFGCYQDSASRNTAAAGGAASSNDASKSLNLQPLPASHDTSIREVDRFVITPELLDKWTKAKRVLDSVTTTNPEIIKHLKSEAPPKNIAEMGKRLEAEPQLNAGLTSAGIDGHNYMLTTIALQTAMHGFQLKTTGKLQANRVPPAIMQNINFVGAHLPQVMSAMMAPGTARTGLKPPG